METRCITETASMTAPSQRVMRPRKRKRSADDASNSEQDAKRRKKADNTKVMYHLLV